MSDTKKTKWLTVVLEIVRIIIAALAGTTGAAIL